MRPVVAPAPTFATAARIMIVDDHAMMRDGLRLLLEKQTKIEVVGTCGDVATAWQMVGDLKPSLVLMDIDLPDGSGLALTRRIRDKFPATKILILTGHVSRDFAREAVTAGAQGYLIKTNATAELLSAIHTVLADGLHLAAMKPADHASGPPSEFAVAAQLVLQHLPAREGQVLGLLVKGLRNKEIASALSLNVKTVESYRSRLMKRFGCNSPAELVRHAIRSGLAVA